MKKILLVLAIFLISCKKEKSNCWECQVVVDGVAHDEKKCGNENGYFTDSSGNELQCYQIH